jgi:hypothetical protein
MWNASCINEYLHYLMSTLPIQDIHPVNDLDHMTYCLTYQYRSTVTNKKQTKSKVFRATVLNVKTKDQNEKVFSYYGKNKWLRNNK